MKKEMKKMKNKSIRKIFDYALEDLDQIILRNPKYINNRKICNKLEDELREFIGKDGYRKFEKFMDAYLALGYVENEEFFVQGFSMANRLRDES